MRKTKPKHLNPAGKRPNRGLALPFFLVLAALTVVAFLIPLRPTRSYTEKRELAKFPAFSAEALTSGDYFDGISAWFSDTFPGRERWISANAKLEQLHGISDVTIYGELPVGDTVPQVIPEITPAAKPEPTPTPVPTDAPEPTPEPTPVPETEVRPPEESVDKWGGILVDEDAEVIFGTTLQIGDGAYGYFSFSQSGCDQYAEVVNRFADAMAEKDVPVYSILVPTSVGVMVSSEYQEAIRCADQGATTTYMYSRMNDNVQKVNIFNSLVSHNEEYIFFRTDHHWTALGAYYAYETFCACAGMEAAALEDFEEWDEGEFKGSFYYNCNQSTKLRLDNVIAYNPPGDLEMKITEAEGNTFPWTVLTDMTKSDPASKYLTFLAGDYPMISIKNNDLPDGPTCVVVKDSYGNPFVPFLTRNYGQIYVLDYRSYKAMGLQAFVEAYDVDDVLIVQSLALAESDGALGLIRKLFLY